MVIFEKLWLQGFGSFIEETKFKLNRPGLNVLIAENGAGKTTAFSGLYWICYGKPLKPDQKGVTTWPHLQPENFEGTRGRVKFTKGNIKYEFIRCQNFKGQVLGAKGNNRLIILEDGKDISPRDKRGENSIQAKINEILGYSQDLFANSIIFGQKLKRLISESGPKKKEIFEEAFEASFLNNARKRGEDDFKAIQKEFAAVQLSYDNLLLQTNSQKELKASYKNAFGRELKKWQEDVEYWKKKCDDLGVEVSKLENITGKAMDIESELSDLRKKHTKLLEKTNLKKLEDEEFRAKNHLDKLEYEVEKEESKIEGLKEQRKKIFTKCPRCGSKLSPKKIKEEKLRIQNDVANCKANIKDKSRDVSEAKAIHEALLHSIASNSKYREQLNDLSTKIKRLETSAINQKVAFKTISSKRNELQEALEKYGKLMQSKVSDKDYKNAIKALKKLQGEKLKLKRELKPLKKKHDNLKWLVNEALSNKGIKAYIFDTMLKQLNDQLKYYTQFIGMRPEFQVDLDGANKDLYATVYLEDGNMVFYSDLSGGQGQLIDVVTAFALHDITIAGRPCNLMVLDEVFESLDEANSDIIFDLIQDKAKDKSLFLITHNINLQNSSTKVIKMHLNKDGQTVLKLLTA